MKVYEPPEDASDTSLQWAGLITKITQGDQAALCALYAMTVHRVYGVALRITGVPAVAEEVVEDVFYQVWSTAATFDMNRGSPLGWLLMMCRSQAIACLRSTDKALARADGDAAAEDCVGQDDNPELLLLAIEENTLLHRALDTLSGQERQLLSLAFFQGFSYPEIAKQMTQPLGTIKSRMRHALRRLRLKLESLDLRRMQ